MNKKDLIVLIEAVARKMCEPEDPDTPTMIGEPYLAHTPRGPKILVKGTTKPLWHFWAEHAERAVLALNIFADDET